jgi:hypothetical protein
MIGWGLLFEQVFERLAGIVGAQAGGRGGLFFAGHADFEEGAIVAGIFFGDALFDGLHALEAAAGIEIHALLARVQFEAALGAESGWRNCLQHGAALGAAGDGAGPGHVHGLRSHAVVAPGRRHGGRLFSRFSFSGRLTRLFIAVAVLISMLTVFGHRTSEHVGVYCLASGASRQV